MGEKLPIILLSVGVLDSFGAKAAKELAADLKRHMNNGLITPHAICIPPRSARQSDRWKATFRDQLDAIQTFGGVAISILPKNGVMTVSEIEDCQLLKELGERWRLWLPKDPLDETLSEEVVKVLRSNLLEFGVSSSRWTRRFETNPTDLQNFTQIEIYLLSDESKRNETIAMTLSVFGAGILTVAGVVAMPSIFVVKGLSLILLPAPCLYTCHKLEQKIIASSRNVTTSELGSYRSEYEDGTIGQDQSLCQMGRMWYPCTVQKGEPTREFSVRDRILDSWVFHCTITPTAQATDVNLAGLEIVLPKERVLLSQKTFDRISVDHVKWKNKDPKIVTLG